MEKMSALQQKIENSFVEFCEEHGHEPRYANCEIEWQDDHDTCDVVFKLSCDVVESEDDQIFYYCNSHRDLKALAGEGMEDFTITDIYSFDDEL